MTRNWKIILALLSVNVTLMGSSYTMIMPFLPVYLEELGASSADLNMWSGFVYGATFAVCAVMAPVWGHLSDRLGLKAMLIRAGCLMAATYLLSSFVTSPTQLFLTRVMQGFSAGMWPASLGIASFYAPKSKLGLSMGIMQSAHVLGAVLGPLIGGVAAETIGIRGSYRLGFSLYVFVTVVSIFLIKSPPVETKDKAGSGHGMRALVGSRAVLYALVCALIGNLVVMMMQPLLTIFVKQLSIDDQNVLFLSGFIFSLSGIAGVIASPLWGRIGQKYGFSLILGTGFIVAALFVSTQGLSNSLTAFAALQFLSGLGFAGVLPSLNALMVRFSDGTNRGAAFGLLFSFHQIGGAAGPVIGGVLATAISLRAVYYGAGLILLISGILVWALLRPLELERTPQQENPQNEDRA